VKANDAVGRNQVIGNLPSTANNDDWYLHFELWKGTTFLNPEKWLSR
jgi:murein DD-endopeptidase MepM/ murein hydrolase activator NlpD